MRKNLIIMSLLSSLIGFSVYAGGIDEYTKLIMHQDSINDYSFYPHKIKPHGNVNSLWFEGKGDFLHSPNHEDWCFNDLDFTIDFWISTDSGARVMEFGKDPALSWQIRTRRSRIQFITNDTVYEADHLGHSFNNEGHVAVVRSGNTLMIFVNGIKKLSQPITSSLFCNTENPLRICRSCEEVLLGEVRISKGIARWTENFTPPTEQYSFDPYTEVKLRYLDGALNMDFKVGTPKPATWKTWISFGDQTLHLRNQPLPVVYPPVSLSIPMPDIHNLGNISILSAIITDDEGIVTSKQERAYTGPLDDSAIPTKEVLQSAFKTQLKMNSGWRKLKVRQ